MGYVDGSNLYPSTTQIVLRTFRILQDQLLFHAILASIPQVISVISSAKTSKEAWDKLLHLFASKACARILGPKERLTLLRRENKLTPTALKRDDTVIATLVITANVTQTSRSHASNRGYCSNNFNSNRGSFAPPNPSCGSFRNPRTSSVDNNSRDSYEPTQPSFTDNSRRSTNMNNTSYPGFCQWCGTQCCGTQGLMPNAAPNSNIHLTVSQWPILPPMAGPPPLQHGYLIRCLSPCYLQCQHSF
ncbi:hypothetical protein L3X38_026673 [Prunus dulcis]|uniref:Uncharacterized protein n=1 Tax=Prunus dulcis TaxID=3755 RepID=A0AAD4YYR1_PRUDU|nr:hypothetical protein L3X38_026673 [Prunus dulcis]